MPVDLDRGAQTAGGQGLRVRAKYCSRQVLSQRRSVRGLSAGVRRKALLGNGLRLCLRTFAPDAGLPSLDTPGDAINAPRSGEQFEGLPYGTDVMHADDLHPLSRQRERNANRARRAVK